MSLPPLQILFEDNHCLAVAKPAGVPSTHFDGDAETVDRQVKAYLKEKYKKPGNVFLGVVHRLDKPVSGVLLFARNSKAAARLAEQFRTGLVQKEYWAIVEGWLDQREGDFKDWLWKDRDAGRVLVVDRNHPEGKESRLHFEHLGGDAESTWVEVHPETGRTHQIRVQFAQRRHPVYGDAKYGSPHTFGNAIALHARSLTFLHPIRYEPITLTAEVPASWKRFQHLGMPMKT